MENSTPHKRRRLDLPLVTTQEAQASTLAALDNARSKRTAREEEADDALLIHPARLISLDRAISPPRSNGEREYVEQATSLEKTSAPTAEGSQSHASITMSSPIQLTRIRDLDASKNVDTVGLEDILGDPLIRECWQFNYLFDVDFLMSHFDEDVRSLVQVKVVHGSWKSEDSNKLRIDEAAGRYRNVQVVTAYMPEAFGTHHSKMMILFRHDDLAQVIIHTANIIPQDWTNMCQAVWRSPLLPLIPTTQGERVPSSGNGPLPSIGSGPRFKLDLLAYLRSYGQAKTGPLTKQLQGYDFTGIRAALVASTPSKVNLRGSDPDTEPLWGWPGLRRVLRSIPTSSDSNEDRPHVVVQVSSIASLGQSDIWLAGTLVNTLAMSLSKTTRPAAGPKPKFSIVFPTADEIRRSLDGYDSGSSIHMKTKSAAQAKQVEYMRPMLCHWAGDQDGESEAQPTTPIREAGRRRAAPHIKTYIRFRDSHMTSIDWAMVTSANLSTQAWGSAESASGEVRTCSYEIGVLVWPGLFDDGNEQRVEMIPVFKQDQPLAANGHICKKIIGFRMPYDLPLVPYSRHEMPWCATSPCSERDWMGRTWPGF